MTSKNTLRIANETIFYGPGPQLLLEKIDETKSLRKTCMETGISYTKALRMLKKIEQELGFEVVHSVKGGNLHGGTSLTEKGKELVRAYSEVEEEVAKTAQLLVDEKFAFLK